MKPTIEQAIDNICRDAVKLHRALDNSRFDTNADATRFTWIGQLLGLQTALCHIHGWNPAEDADKEGKADELICAWWEREHPQEWAKPH